MCGGNHKKKTLAPAATTPAVPQIVQEMTRASEMGPTGWSPAMVANMGPLVNTTGPSPTSGMVNFTKNNFAGYTPRPAAKPAAPQPVVRTVPLPKVPPPKVPVVPNPKVPITSVVPPPPVTPAVTNPDLLKLIQGATGRNAR